MAKFIVLARKTIATHVSYKIEASDLDDAYVVAEDELNEEMFNEGTFHSKTEIVDITPLGD